MARRQAERDAGVGQYRVDFVRDGFDERDEEGRSSDAIGFLDQLNEGELRRAVDGDEKESFPSAVCTSAMSMWKKPMG